MNTSLNDNAFHPIRHDRLLQEAEHDSYQSKGKLHEPTVCPDCGAVFHEGRWQWLERPADAHEERCPACQRLHDEFPAGYVHLTGDFLNEHEVEILNLVRHQETQEKSEHPLKRIMNTERTPEGYLITTTDIHLARRIGEAIHHAYQGDLEFHYNPQQFLLRVTWQR